MDGCHQSTPFNNKTQGTNLVISMSKVHVYSPVGSSILQVYNQFTQLRLFMTEIIIRLDTCRGCKIKKEQKCP